MRPLLLILLLLLPTLCVSCESEPVVKLPNKPVLPFFTWTEFAGRAVYYRDQHVVWPSDPHQVLTAADPGETELQYFCNTVRLNTLPRGLDVISLATGKLLFTVDALSTAEQIQLTHEDGSHATLRMPPPSRTGVQH